MRNKLSLSLSILAVAASTAFAQFEGNLEMKVSTTDGEGNSQTSGTMKMAVSKAGARTEMNMAMGGMTMNMVMLFKTDNPNVLYKINDANKSYMEINLAKMREMAPRQQNEDKVTVTKLGEEKLLGYKTQHVLVVQGEMTNEMWTAKDFMDFATYSKLQPAGARKKASSEALTKALKDAGADGMPLKSVTPTGDGGKATMEVVKADKQSLPAATFEIPAGYTKSAGGMMDMMGGMSGPKADEAHKAMEDAMKNMTPEQREMMEKAMKAHGMGGQQQ